MVTQFVFKIDKKLKETAQAKAKKEGISLADVYKIATKQYVDGVLNVGFVRELIPKGFVTPNKKTAVRLKKAMKEIKAGVGLSPAFHTIKEMNDYLDNLK
jgi:antitoxin component of RelBE/YafQ-DinJ toxin-antitoxin module